MNIAALHAGKQLFIGTVVVPVVLATAYFATLASDVFVSESRFVVRSAQKAEGGAAIGELFKGFGTAGAENVLLLRDHLLAREVMQAMDARFKLREMYGQADFASRFPAPWQRPTLEEFADYYQDRVRLEVDASSSVGVLTVRSFAADTAHAINTALLAQAQTRLAELNAKIRRDSQDLAERELARAKRRLADADEALAMFRRHRGLLDPEKQAVLELQGVQELNAKLVAVHVRLDQARQLAPLSPQVISLETELAALERAAAQANAAAVGAGHRSRVSSAQDYQALQLERDLASRNLGVAHEALLRARVDAERQHLYLETVSAPSVPDSALQPRRVRSIGAVLILSLAVFAVLSLARAGVQEHGQSL